MEIFIWIVCILVGLFLVGWLGLQIKPKSFPLFQPQNAGHADCPAAGGLACAGGAFLPPDLRRYSCL